MSAAEDYMRSYRVKFVDVRVNPPGGRRKAGAYVRRCEHKGCDELGLCKAPKPFSARVVQIPGKEAAVEDHHWFCQRHASEYNENFDFFEGNAIGAGSIFDNGGLETAAASFQIAIDALQ